MVNLDYFYGSEGEQYRFYQIPAVLLEDDEYKKISDTAKILYGILLSRLAMSKKNNWIEEDYGASCTAPEMTIKTCERCGKKETTTKGKPIGHKWGKWQLVSVNASGVRNYRTCVRCGLKQYKNSRYKLKIRGVVNQINWNRILKA